MTLPIDNETPIAEFRERGLHDLRGYPITELDFRASVILHTEKFRDGAFLHRALREGRVVYISQIPTSALTTLSAPADQP